jgi:hypothetical protein
MATAEKTAKKTAAKPAKKTAAPKAAKSSKKVSAAKPAPAAKTSAVKAKPAAKSCSRGQGPSEGGGGGEAGGRVEGGEAIRPRGRRPPSANAAKPAPEGFGKAGGGCPEVVGETRPLLRESAPVDEGPEGGRSRKTGPRGEGPEDGEGGGAEGSGEGRLQAAPKASKSAPAPTAPALDAKAPKAAPAKGEGQGVPEGQGAAEAFPRRRGIRRRGWPDGHRFRRGRGDHALGGRRGRG